MDEKEINEENGWEYEQPYTIGKKQFAEKAGYSTGYYFREKVHHNKVIMRKLKKAGYKITLKELSARMSNIIQEANGRFYKK